MNSRGKGRAYYLAARVTDEAFYAGFYAALVKEAGVLRAVDSELPEGVTAQLRSDGETDYVFLLNFSGREETVDLDGKSYTDLEQGGAVGQKIELPQYGVRILARAAK